MKKIISPHQLPTLKEHLDQKSRVIVGGCFDILHPGHIAFLLEAKEIGDILILFLESDEAVRNRKGQGRPINTIETRSKNLLNQTPVDIIIALPFPFIDSDYDNLVTEIKPDIIATTKGDPFISHKLRQAKKIGAKVVAIIERLPDHSTTNSLK